MACCQTFGVDALYAVMNAVMKVLFLSVFLLGLALPAAGLERADLDYRIRKLTVKLEAMQAKADRSIPAPMLRAAEGIVLLDRTKAGFIFAYQGGSGIAMVRNPRNGQWGAPAFLKANEASLGFQIGGQQSFVVLLLMNTNAVQLLAQGTVKLSGEAAGTAGDISRGTEAGVSSLEPLIRVYTDKEGLYGGAAVKGDSLAPDIDANLVYYDQSLTLPEILFSRKLKVSEATAELAGKLGQMSR